MSLFPPPTPADLCDALTQLAGALDEARQTLGEHLPIATRIRFLCLSTQAEQLVARHHAAQEAQPA